MTTEITDLTSSKDCRGWIGYDGACPFCCRMVARFGPTLLRRRLAAVPLQSSWMRARLGLRAGELPDEMKLVLADGRVLGGARAVTWLARRIWWLAPLGWLLWLPGVRPLTVAGYRQLARRRYCLLGARTPARKPRHGTAAFFKMP